MVIAIFKKSLSHLKTLVYPAPKNIHYRYDIDGLRAIAVLSVVAFHTFPKWVSGGFVGVDVFFVISGFLITGIIYKTLRLGHFSFLDFWARRIRRIFPSLLVVVLTTFAIGWFYLLPAEFDILKSHIKWGLSFLANFKLSSEVGYFDTAAELKPLLHLWSLAIEEQFYLVWPIVIWLSFRLKLNVFIVTFILAALSYMSRKYFGQSESEIFYLPWTRFWELQIGAMLVIWNLDYSAKFNDHFLKLELKLLPNVKDKNRSSLLPFIKSTLATVGFGLIVYACLKLTKETPFPSKQTLFPVVGAALMISADKEAWFNRKVLSLSFMGFIGVISFPLYLWHWPLLSYLRIVLNEPSPKILITAVVISFILAAATYYTVEKFLRFETGRIPWRAPALVTALCGFVIFLKYGEINPRSSQFGVDKINAALSNRAFPLADAKAFPNGLGYFEVETKIPKRVLFIGDSHMDGYWQAVVKLSKQNPYRIKSSIFANQGGCIPVIGYKRSDSPGCVERIEKILEIIRNRAHFGITKVIWNHRWDQYLELEMHDQYDHNGVLLTGVDKIKARKNGLEEFLKQLKSSGVPVTVVLDQPSGKEFAPNTMLKRTLKGFELGPATVDREVVENRHPISRPFMFKIAKKYNANVLDTFEFLCKNKVCQTRDSVGRPLYFDDNHFTPYASEEFLSFIENELTDSEGDNF